MILNTVDQAASRTRPLGASMLHATARETHPVLRRNAVNLKRIQHLLRYRRIGCDVDNLTRLNDYSQQVRTWFRSRPGARRLSFVGFDTHGVDRMALGFRELRATVDVGDHLAAMKEDILIVRAAVPALQEASKRGFGLMEVAQTLQACGICSLVAQSRQRIDCAGPSCRQEAGYQGHSAEKGHRHQVRPDICRLHSV
jgi:hypothetical protein